MTRDIHRAILRFALAATVVLAYAHPALGQSAPGGGVDLSAAADNDPVIRREIDLARARGMPVEPLLGKVREGRLKRAPLPRIRTAVAALAMRLDTARVILGPDATLEELTAGADALAAGAKPAELRLVSSASEGRPVSAPMGALAQLVASGVPSRRAAEMVVDLLRRKLGGAVVLAFGNLVESDVASGMPAEEAAAFRLHSLATGGKAALTPSSPTSAGTSSLLTRPSPVQTKPRRRP